MNKNKDYDLALRVTSRMEDRSTSGASGGGDRHILQGPEDMLVDPDFPDVIGEGLKDPATDWGEEEEGTHVVVQESSEVEGGEELKDRKGKECDRNKGEGALLGSSRARGGGEREGSMACILGDIFGIDVQSGPPGLNRDSQEFLVDPSVPTCPTGSILAQNYFEGIRYIPPNPRDKGVNFGIYANTNVPPSLTPNLSSYETKTDPSWLGDRRCLTMCFREWKAQVRGGDSSTIGTARTGVCYSCGPNKIGSHPLADGNQSVLIIGDTYLPPVIGYSGRCIPIVRLQVATPESACTAVLKFFGHTPNVPKAVWRSHVPPFLVVIIALTTHLRRVGVHDYINDLGVIANRLLDKFTVPDKILRIGTVVVPFMRDEDGKRDTLARDSIVLANLLNIVKLSNNNKLPLFVGGYNAMVKDTSTMKKEYMGLSVSVPANSNMFGTGTAPIRMDPSVKLKGCLGYDGLAAYGSAMTPSVEFKFVTSLVDELKLYLDGVTDFYPPSEGEIGQIVAEAIPRTNDYMMTKRMGELQRLGVPAVNMQSVFNNMGPVVLAGGSECKTIQGTLKEQVSQQVLAMKVWKPSLIRIRNSDPTAAHKKILQPEFENLFTAEEGGVEPVVVVRYLNAELLGAKSGRLAEVIGKRLANFNHNQQKTMKRKRDAPDCPSAPARICIRSPEIKRPAALLPILEGLVTLVTELRQLMCEVILVLPFPRHFSRCCADPTHFGQDFPHDDYQKIVFELSTFLSCLPSLADAWVVHPGEVIGWEAPVEREVVDADGVHLTSEVSGRVTQELLRIIRLIRANPAARPKRVIADRLKMEMFPAFVSDLRRRGITFLQPVGMAVTNE